MNKSVKTGLITGIILLILAAGGIGYYLYNKGPLNVRTASSTPVTATDLYSSYLSDTSTAQKKYSGKVLEVSGLIAEVTSNQQGEQLVLLKTGAEGGHVNCTMEEKAEGLKPGMQVTVKGICSGMGAGDADLGIMGDVYLTRSLISK